MMIGTTVVAIAAMSTAALAAPAGMARAGEHSVSSSAAAPGARTEHSVSVPGKVRPEGAYTNCQSGLYCDYSGTDGNDTCIYGAVTTNWSNDFFQCRNSDESFANRLSGLIRLYYSPGEAGAWVCIDASKYDNNFSSPKYTFNNEGTGNTAGYGKPIVNNVASSEVASGSCSNPLPLP